VTVFQKSVARTARDPRGADAAVFDIAIPALALPDLPELPRQSPLDFRWRLPQWQLPNLALPSLPRVQMPRVQMPRMRMPRVVLPRVTVPRMPRWQMPRVPSPRFPSIQWPRVQMPKVQLARVRIPAWQWPRLQMPNLQMPRVRLPQWRAPEWRMPQWRLPRVQWPALQLPGVQLPKLQAPRMPGWRLPSLETRLRLATAAAFGFGIAAPLLLFSGGTSDRQEPVLTASVVAPIPAVDAPGPAQTPAPQPKPTLDQDGLTKLVSNIVTGAGPDTGSDGASDPTGFLKSSTPSTIAALPEQDLQEHRPHPPMLSVGAQPLDTEEIEVLQMKLRALQYYAGAVSGALSERTIRAFNAWRNETGRPQSESVDRDDLQTFLVAINR
jgi:hypothetical protein